MRTNKKKVLLVLAVFVLIQFMQPAENRSAQLLSTDLTKRFKVPDNVQAIIKNACYDCHSNNTMYPWYIHIQPVGWLLASHIKSGKKSLNFSEFGSYSNRMQRNKLKGVANQIEDDAMPLSSYKWMHRNARLTKGEKTAIINWMNQTADSLSSVN